MIAPSPETPAVIALGEAMIEFNQARADAPESYARGYGGDTSNMVIAPARLGAVAPLPRDAAVRALLGS